MVRSDLRQDRLDPLPERGAPGEHPDGARGVHLDRGLLVRPEPALLKEITGANAHQSRPARDLVVTASGSIGSVPHLAPASIHARRAAVSASDGRSGTSGGGMVPAATRLNSGDSSGFPGTTFLRATSRSRSRT